MEPDYHTFSTILPHHEDEDAKLEVTIDFDPSHECVSARLNLADNQKRSITLTIAELREVLELATKFEHAHKFITGKE